MRLKVQYEAVLVLKYLMWLGNYLSHQLKVLWRPLRPPQPLRTLQ